MTCPRCNYEWDVSKSPCPRCGLSVHLPGRLGARPLKPAGEGAGTQPPVAPSTRLGQQSGRLPTLPPFPSRIVPTNQQPDIKNALREAKERSQSAFPARPQQNQQDTPPSPFPKPLPEPPPLANAPSLSQSNSPFLARLQREEPTPEPPATHHKTDDMPPRNVPQRPQVQPSANHAPRSTENLLSEVRPVRPGRLVTDSLIHGNKQRQSVPLTPIIPSTFLPAPLKSEQPFVLPALVPRTLLRGGRYRLSELQRRQDWLEGISETTWIAQDAQRTGSQVAICELVTSDTRSMGMQSMLRKATIALTSVGRNAHIPTLWDAFSEQGRSFFVFEPAEGESIAAQMHRTGRALPEQEVVECCLQITEILELLAQQTPSMVHGLIQPEHIIIGRASVDYMLTNFSLVLASGATQYVSGIDHSHLSPYAAPEFGREKIDGRVDLYALLATAYHAVTGSMPTNSGGSIPQAQRLNPTVSPAFDAVLARGLHSVSTQRYQRVSELRQDLLALTAVPGSVTTGRSPAVGRDTAQAGLPIQQQKARTVMPLQTGDSLSQLLPSLLASGVQDDQEQRLLLPRPEELAPMPAQNDLRYAAIWLVGILLCLILIVIVSRGLV